MERVLQPTCEALFAADRRIDPEVTFRLVANLKENYFLDLGTGAAKLWVSLTSLFESLLDWDYSVYSLHI